MAATVLERATFTAQELEGMVKSNLGAFLPDSCRSRSWHSLA